MGSIMAVLMETTRIGGAVYPIDYKQNPPVVVNNPTLANPSNELAVLGDLNQYKRRLYTFLNEFKSRLGKSFADVEAVACIHTGRVDSKAGNVIWAERFNLANIPIVQMIEDLFKLPAYVFHDCIAMAAGEYGYARNPPEGKNARKAGSVPENFLYVVVGEGVGSSIYIGGKPYLGFNEYAGNIGHAIVEPNGPICYACQRKGCLETYTSRRAIAGNVLAAFKLQQITDPAAIDYSSFYNRMLRETNDQSQITPSFLHDAAEERNRFVLEAVTEAANHLGAAMCTVIDYIDPEEIILGGELLSDFTSYFTMTKNVTERLRAKADRHPPVIRQPALHADVGVFRGAVELTLERRQEAAVSNAS